MINIQLLRDFNLCNFWPFLLRSDNPYPPHLLKALSKKMNKLSVTFSLEQNRIALCPSDCFVNIALCFFGIFQEYF